MSFKSSPHGINKHSLLLIYDLRCTLHADRVITVTPARPTLPRPPRLTAAATTQHHNTATHAKIHSLSHVTISSPPPPPVSPPPPRTAIP
ncbi:hypothetical protein E2C01_095660 [Portunus trituberculatus]|uniref:Uncharacterized protein n=1 Tax=Portunus trituberculatus TaxID=210409 RepID=A0A5B7JQE3_PORTR|nr:hypothetical protein [Portunus trituberculatus]